MADSNRKNSGTRRSQKSQSGSRGTSRTSSRQSARRGAKKEEDLGFMRAEAAIICSFAIALLLFLSNFRLCGALGEVLRSVQLGIFGMVGFLVPILVFVGTCFHLSNRGSFRAALKMGAVVLAVITVCGLLQLFFGLGEPGTGWTSYYSQSAASGMGGGWLGGVTASLLVLVVGRAGACLVLLVLLILSLVCITERSFVNAVRQGGGKAYRYAREDMDRRRENHALRQEERRQMQREREMDLEEEEKEDPREFPDVMNSREKEPFASGVSDLRQEPEHRPGPADTFRGSIHMAEPCAPQEEPEDEAGQDEISRLAWTQSREREQKEEDREPEPSYMLHRDQEDAFRIPVRRRTGTFREMDFLEDEESREEEAPQAVSAIEPEDQTPTEEPLQAQVQTEPKSVPWEEPAAPEEEASGVREPEDQSIHYDSVFVPDEPKTVVTASGKVIETETELLEKKLEKKREEAAGEKAEEAAVPKVEEPPREYVFPPLSLLKRAVRNPASASQSEYKATAIKLQQTLHNFGVGVTVTNISCGPAVTRYELLPEQGVKVSKIVSLADDIKLSLAAADIRIEAPIPGKSAVGIEVPNKENNVVYLRELLESEAFRRHKSSLAFAVGKDIGGQVVVTDIAKMPHLLIAGATGSGKSVCINTLIMSMIYKSRPEEVRMIMIDPKVVELSVYNGIPHLLIPVVTDPKKASGALSWAVAEMQDRYKKFAQCNVRDLKGYNERVDKLKDIEMENKPSRLPQIVIIIDELADLMMVAPGEVEESICRLAQLARAAGIHLVIATQRPSVNVITGLIKANVPSRIAFSVSSGVDSRTIIDMNGAEKLLGKGDMLFYPAGYPKPQRVQGAFVSDEEVGRVVEFLTQQGLTAQYSPEVESRIEAPAGEGQSAGAAARDEYFERAGQLIIDKEKASIGMLQRTFKIGFNRAARIMDQLADAGVVGPEEGTKPRKILMTPQEFQEFLGAEQKQQTNNYF